MTSAKSVEALKEDFLDIDAKSLFRNQGVLTGPKAPANAPVGMGGQQQPMQSATGIAQRLGYVRPSERVQEPVHYEQSNNPWSAQQYQQQPQYSQQYYQQQYAPPPPQVDVMPYKGAINELLGLLSHKLTHAEWMGDPAIANALRMLQ